MDEKTYNHWKSVAQRFCGKPEEAADLLHASLEVAIRKGRIQLGGQKDAGWFYGVLKNVHAHSQRSLRRRLIREQSAGRDLSTNEQAPSPFTLHRPVLSWIQGLSPAVRVVVLLGLHGLTQEETRRVLDISPTAYRKRLQVGRKKLSLLPTAVRGEIEDWAQRNQVNRAHKLDLGLIRKALLAGCVPGSDGKVELGTHDPDGHLLVIGVAPKR